MAWEQRKLGEIAYLAGRIGWKGLTAKEYTKGGPLFTSVHALNHGDYVDFGEAFHISQERYDESPEIMLAVNDILICKDGAGIGKLGIVAELPGPATINSSLLLIRALPEVDPKFLYRALCSPIFQKIVREKIDGATTPHLYQREIRQFSIPLPPFREQRRIVAILDEAFEGIDTAIANTEKNLANARALFTQFINSTFSPDTNRWNRKKLGEVCNFAGGSQPPKSDFIHNYEPGYVRFLQIRDFDSEKYTTFIPVSRKNRLCENDDVLIGRYGASVGKILTGKGGAYNVALIKTIPNVRALNRSWLYYFLQSAAFQGPLAKVASRSAQAGFSKEDIYSFSIPVPLLSEQELLSSRFDTMSLDCDRLGSICREKLMLLADLKQSILHKAFAGELTAHPDKALREAAE